jgi:hypothetical protein
VVELEVSSADKQGKDFTQVQGPRVEVTPLRPACLLLLCEYDDYKGPGEMSISLGFVALVVRCLVRWPSQSLNNRLGPGCS